MRLERAANATPPNPAAIRAYAEFLDRYQDPAAGRCTRASPSARTPRRPGGPTGAGLSPPGDSRSGGGRPRGCHARIWRLSPRPAVRACRSGRAPGGSSHRSNFIEIPGPSSAFARMAALAPDMRRGGSAAGARPQRGHQRLSDRPWNGGPGTNRIPEAGDPLSLAGARTGKAGRTDKILRIETCDSTATGDLLRVLGYRMRGGCGATWCWKR